MPGRIRQEDVEAVRERADIVKVVSGYLALKKTGRDSRSGICPFHPEKTASFSVSPTKQVYHCFGCGEGGNVFSFLQKIENLTFPEAVERLADEVGVTLRHEVDSPGARKAADRRELIHRANAEAAGLYTRTLLDGREGAQARTYLEERRISRASVERFGVGYAPMYQDFLLRRLSKSFSAELLLEAGLATKDGRGDVVDRFRGRVMFPTHDLSKKVVGFGGRLLSIPGKPAREAAKYINTAETPVYHKSALLYNLHRAKEEANRTQRAFLVEGYTDVIALDQAGVASAVATCGTALGEDHLRLLSRFFDRAVLAFDSDEAGARAAERAYRFHQQYPVDIHVLVLPAGEDPADFVTARGEAAGEAFLQLADGATPLVEYMIDRTLAGRPLDGVEDRARAVRDALQIVVGLEDPVRRQSYARAVAAKTGERETAVMMQLEAMTDRADDGAKAAERPHASRTPPQQKVEREALKLLVQARDRCPPDAAALRLEPERFATPTYRKAYEFLEGSAATDPSTLVALAQDRGEQLGRLVAALAIEPTEGDGEPSTGYAEAVFTRLEEFWLARRIDELRRELERINPQKEPERFDGSFEQLVKLEGRRRRIKEGMSSAATA